MSVRILLIACLILINASAAFAGIDFSSLQTRVNVIAKSFKGHLGVGVIDVQSGESWYLNADERFRMQSVAKILIAMAALRQVDEGKLKLDQDVPLTRSDVDLIRDSYIRDPLPRSTTTLKLSALLEKSVCRSNNGAADLTMKLLGGPTVVDKFLKDEHFSDIRVDRYEMQLSLDDDHHLGAEMLDSCSPRAICSVLSKLQSGQLLSAKSTSYLLGLMRRCETGQNRLRAGFPKDWIVANKTGTGREMFGVTVSTNDVGIVTGPNKSTWIVAVLIGDAKLSRIACEGKIAEVAKAVSLAVR
jgi:beta-lactamase class A